MSAPGQPCIRCGTPLVEDELRFRCPKCGFLAKKGGMIIDMGGRSRPRTLVCPLCGGMASEDLFEEFTPKKAMTSTPVGPAANLDLKDIFQIEEVKE